MSIQRREKRKLQRDPNSYINILAQMLSELYDFLDQKPQPSDEDVREKFTSGKEKWVKYCDSNKMTDYAKDLYARNVEEMWKRKYTTKAPQ